MTTAYPGRPIPSWNPREIERNGGIEFEGWPLGSVTVELDPRCPAQIAHAKWCAENAGLVERQMADAAREWREFAEKWRAAQ